MTNTTIKTPYELYSGRKQNLGYLKVFGSKSYILIDMEQLEKFEPKSDEGIFLGYSDKSKDNRVFNHRTITVMELAHVVIDETNQVERALHDVEGETLAEQSTPSRIEDNIPSTSTMPTRLLKDHNLDNIIGDIKSGVMTRRQVHNLCAHYSFVS